MAEYSRVRNKRTGTFINFERFSHLYCSYSSCTFIKSKSLVLSILKRSNNWGKITWKLLFFLSKMLQRVFFSLFLNLIFNQFFLLSNCQIKSYCSISFKYKLSVFKVQKNTTRMLFQTVCLLFLGYTLTRTLIPDRTFIPDSRLHLESISAYQIYGF